MIKTRVKGLFKMLGGLALCSPAVVSTLAGMTISMSQADKMTAVVSEFEASSEYPVAIAKRDDELAKLGVSSNNKPNSVAKEFFQYKYLNSYYYIHDYIYTTELAPQLKEAERNRNIGLAIMGGGAVLGTAFTYTIARCTRKKEEQKEGFLECSYTRKPHENLITRLLDEGTHELSTGKEVGQEK